MWAALSPAMLSRSESEFTTMLSYRLPLTAEFNNRQKEVLLWFLVLLCGELDLRAPALTFV